MLTTLFRICLLCTFALAGCGSPEGTQSPASSNISLSGIWEVQLKIHQASYRLPNARGDVLLQVELSAIATGVEAEWVADGVATHDGDYRGNLEALGIHPYILSKPRVAARLTSPSEVKVLLHPDVGHGSVALVGVRTNAGFAGDWQVNEYAGGARGTFLMERRQERLRR